MRRSPTRIVSTAAGMLAGAALVAPAVTEATTLEELSLSAMVRQAEVIVTGTCERVESRWVGRTLYTLATVRVAETLKGEARRELTLVVPGGMDLKRPIPIAVTYPGAPVVMQGQGLVLLLEPFAEVADGFAAVGFSQGALPVMRDEAGRSLVLRRGASAGGAVPLSALRSEILSYLEEQR